MGGAYPAPSSGNNLTVAFGLIQVGVKYAPIVESKGRVSGKFLDPATKTPAKQQYVNEAGEPVEKITGYPHGDGFVVLSPGDTDALKSERDGRLELKAFIEPEGIDALYIEKTLLVWPQPGQEASYDVLLAVLRKSGRHLVGTSVLTKSTKVVVLRYFEAAENEGCILAQVCEYDQNVRWGNHRLVVGAASEREPADEALVDMALQVFETLDDTFDLSSVTDEYDERLRAAIVAKAEGKEIVPVKDDAPAPVADLMEALKATVAASKAAKKEATKAPAKKRPAKKAA